MDSELVRDVSRVGRHAFDETDHVRHRLVIDIRTATGVGPTSLAAFDAALVEARVANYNLVRLSSVIPPNSQVAAVDSAPNVIDLTDGAANLAAERAMSVTRHPSAQWGHRLYAVWAYQSAELLGEEAWAGVAWVQHPEDGRGLFVEHEGPSETQVREELNASLSSISIARGLQDYEFHSVVVGTRCEGQPVAALVIAPFKNEPW